MNDEALLQQVEDNPRQTTKELSAAMGCDQSTIVRHLESLGKVPKLGCWIPHELTERDREFRVTIVSSLLSLSLENNWMVAIYSNWRQEVGPLRKC